METIKNFPADAISEIRVKSSLSQVNIVAGSSADIVVHWTDTKRRTTTAVLTGSVLSVEDHGVIALYGVIGLIQLKADKELTLELPSNFSGHIQVESKDESIRVVGVDAPCALRAKTTDGAIDISVASIRSCELTSLSGAMTLHGVTSETGMRMSTNNGNIDVFCGEDASGYLLDCQSEHGQCSLPETAHRGKKMMYIRSKTGNITVGFTR